MKRYSLLHLPHHFHCSRETSLTIRPQVRRVMNALDKDASGTISFEEFVNLLFCLIYGIALE